MARSPAELARIAARRHSARTFQSTDMNPTPSPAWIAAWRLAHLACGGIVTTVATDRAIALWSLGSTSRAAGDSTATEQKLAMKLVIESTLADLFVAQRAMAAL